MLKQNKKDKQDRHRWLLIAFSFTIAQTSFPSFSLIIVNALEISPTFILSTTLATSWGRSCIKQDRHRWLLIGFLCLFGVCLVAQVRPTEQKTKATGTSTKSVADTSKTTKKHFHGAAQSESFHHSKDNHRKWTTYLPAPYVHYWKPQLNWNWQKCDFKYPGWIKKDWCLTAWLYMLKQNKKATFILSTTLATSWGRSCIWNLEVVTPEFSLIFTMIPLFTVVEIAV